MGTAEEGSITIFILSQIYFIVAIISLSVTVNIPFTYFWIMGKVLSGREDYEAIIEERKVVRRCGECNWALVGGEKFCPECGAKI